MVAFSELLSKAPEYQGQLLLPVNDQRADGLIDQIVYSKGFLHPEANLAKTHLTLTSHLVALNSPRILEQMFDISFGNSDYRKALILSSENSGNIYRLARFVTATMLTGVSEVNLKFGERDDPLLNIALESVRDFQDRTFNVEEAIERVPVIFGTREQSGTLASALKQAPKKYFQQEDMFIDALRLWGNQSNGLILG